MHKYGVNEVIVYRPDFGTGKPEVVAITGLGEKNGKPVYGLDNGRWCYEHQIDMSILAPVNLTIVMEKTRG